MPNLDALLAKRNAHRINQAGDPEQARERLNHSRFLARHFVSFDALRPHLTNPLDHPRVERPQHAQEAIDYLREVGWIASEGTNVWRVTDQAGISGYLAGGWLEELVYCAHEEAGVDEAYFAQEIEWRVGDVTGKNEIDVIARRGDILSFTSCKTMRPYRCSDVHLEHLRAFLTEADYWNIHFADDQGRALLVVTADFLNEMRNNRHRYPRLMAHASILEVSVAGLERLRWPRLVETVEKHWGSP